MPAGSPMSPLILAKSSWCDACRDVAKYVRGTSADLVLLQEVFMHKDADALIAAGARGHLKYSQVPSDTLDHHQDSVTHTDALVELHTDALVELHCSAARLKLQDIHR